MVSEAKIAPGEAQTLDIEQAEAEREVQEPMACFRSASQVSVSQGKMVEGARAQHARKGPGVRILRAAGN